ERSNLLGSAHMDFEFNQSKTLQSNGVSPVRTKNDILIDYDFGGSGVPVLALHKWITSDGGSVADCEASNTLPCWNKAVDLVATGFAEGAVNAGPVTDSVGPGGTITLAGSTANNGTVSSTFGEAGINLTDSNIFPAGQCETFGNAWLKSRSSGNSFSSELKDIIAPIPVNISNCGSIVLKKVTVPAGANQDFGYTETAGGLTPTTVTLNASGTDTKTYSNVPAGGPETFAENDPSCLGWDLTNLSCSNGGGTSTFTTDKPTRTASVTNLVAGETVTCTYTNTQRGAIKVVKITNPSSDTTTQFGFTPVGFNGGSTFNLVNGVANGQTF